MIRCAASNIESPNRRITESANQERISKYSLHRTIESPNIESWRIFLIFDPSNIESPNRFGYRIFHHDSVIRYSVIEYRILRITEYSMVRYPYSQHPVFIQPYVKKFALECRLHPSDRDVESSFFGYVVPRLKVSRVHW